MILKNKPLIFWTWKNCAKVVPKNLIYVATDSTEIHDACKKYGINTINTGKKHLTGTDRIAEAAKKLDTDLIINIQGDEPFIKPKDIKSFINFALKNKRNVTNAYTLIKNKKNNNNINIPKLVLSKDKKLLYMSRSAVPGSKNNFKNIKIFKQVCIYGFPKDILLKIYGLKKMKTKLEKIEDIEILRVIENDIPVKMYKVSDNILAIDTMADLNLARRFFK
jgi:3-deoxy-manno-octulosonate cytidylyltransferase (CMP-KDO synthetase)